ncbi:rhamnogalacturonidase [Flavobacterium gilvum]|uniref:Exopolygalacturonase n=1 Tax=Flavobacterium gilvum TaxID=1492737 RepID=A0AAC9I7Y1_9FLAO|nr:glycosyl hydrolase family 28 protein [Flavobacterium gilvum]AOW10833.1 exopolygalacturonase [Flavobacterium gilvum]KFC59923.1 glycoside hydrolase [Flavobacterium gilvum]
MKNIFSLLICLIGFSQMTFSQKSKAETFPDGTAISKWFKDYSKIKLEKLGKQYVVTNYGVNNDSTKIQTAAIQAVIDKASANGGGVIIIPKGVFLSGALFFKPKTSLHVSEGATLKGSDDISNFPIMPSRMEGQNLDYFPALVNAYGVDDFSITGKGTINGNGYKYYEAFWARRKENPKCTNLEVSRPRLVFVWNSNNVQFQDVKLINSGFWTNHFYKCNNVKLIDLYIFSPGKEIKAPSTDAIDVDICTNVLIKGCYMSVNDDAIALKGGKGPYADKDPNNGANNNIIIEDCHFGFCHSALTNGSESIHNRNVIMRNCKIEEASRLLWLKMRPDTPQLYEYIRVENIKGDAKTGLAIFAWKQFFDLKGRPDIPLSYGDHVTLKNIDLKCDTFYGVENDPNVRLSNFTFENIKVESKKDNIDKSLIKGVTFKNVVVNNKKVE